MDTIIFAGKSNWTREMEDATDPDLIYIARNGHIIGRYYQAGILKGFDCGFFLPTDLGWERELGAWMLLTEIVNVPAASRTRVVPAAPAASVNGQRGATLHLTPEPGQELESPVETEAAR